MVSVSTAWVYGSGMIHGAINCNNYKSDTSRGCHTWHGYQLHGYGYHGHRHLVHGVGCMSIEDAGHGISIGCIDIEYHQNRTPHMASASTAWVWYRHRFNGHYGHRHLVHGIGCMSIEDAGHGISIDCMGMGIMAMDIEYHQNRMPHTASVSVQWVSVP